MTKDIMNLIFAGISAICAVISLLQAHSTKKRKDEAEEIVDKLKRNIRSINDLENLEQQIKELKKLSKNFRTISNGKLNQRGCIETDREKAEIDYYIKLKENTVKILEVLPSEYKKVRDALNDIIGAFSFCITSNRTFPELDRNNIYSYEYIESKYLEALTELNQNINNIKYLDVDEQK